MSTRCEKSWLNMFTRCPHCDKQHSVTTQQIRYSRGLLICAGCGQSFDGLASLCEQADERPFLSNNPEFWLKNSDKTKSVLRWRFGSLVMLLTLFAQIVYFEGSRLTGQPQIRQVLLTVCQALGLQASSYNNPDDWALSHSDLQTHLGQRYLLTTALTNQAEVDQAFPKLKLTLTDFKGQVLAQRVFDPQQYTNEKVLMANQTAFVRLPIILPGHEIGGYSLNLM